MFFSPLIAERFTVLMSTILKAFPVTTSNLARTIATAAVALRAYKETSYTAVMGEVKDPSGLSRGS